MTDIDTHPVLWDAVLRELTPAFNTIHEQVEKVITDARPQLSAKSSRSFPVSLILSFVMSSTDRELALSVTMRLRDDGLLIANADLSWEDGQTLEQVDPILIDKDGPPLDRIINVLKYFALNAVEKVILLLQGMDLPTDGGFVSTAAPATSSVWTNSSVLIFAEDRDPIQLMIEKAKAVAYNAIENGWSGPPFDPIALAELRGIPLVPRDDLYDARTVSVDGRPIIEYNPTRPRPRVRYSIAHEIAHTFFPDFSLAIRERAHIDPAHGNDWQLESLCNIGASELLMPSALFTPPEDDGLSIDWVLAAAREFGVSVEAALLRVAKTTSRPCAVFAGFRADDSLTGEMNVEYVVSSRSWTPPFSTGKRLPPGDVTAECTAVGYTAKRVELHGDQIVRVECVGLPPYPGSSYPRVAGLLQPESGDVKKPGEIIYLAGDATDPRIDGPALLVHMVNDVTPNWGGQFALSLARRHPEAQELFRKWVQDDPKHLTLGNVHFSEVASDHKALSIASIVGQRGYGSSKAPRIRYGALRAGLEVVGQQAEERGASVHMPRIGAGQAGGSWRVIEEIIGESLVSRSLVVIIYDPAGRPFRQRPEQETLFG